MQIILNTIAKSNKLREHSTKESFVGFTQKGTNNA